MKRCPTCQTEYPDDANWCRIDGGRLHPVQPAAVQQPGALTMGWDVQPDPAAPPASPARAPQQPGALTSGWDAQPDPTAPPPSQPASSARTPYQPGALTMGWDAQPEPEPERAPSTMSPAALAARSVATSHAPGTPAPGKSPAATLLGMQAPWQQAASAPAIAAPAATAPPPGATAAYSAQHVPSAPSSVVVEPALVAPPPGVVAPAPTAAAAAASSPDATHRTRPSSDSALDRPPRNRLPLYALIAVVVLAAALTAIVLAMR